MSFKMSGISDKNEKTLSIIKSQSSTMLWIWNPEPKKGGRGRAEVNSRFGEFCIFVFKISKYEIKVIKWKVVNIEFQAIKNVSKCWFHVSYLLVSSQQVLDSPFYFPIVKKCRSFSFIFFKNMISGLSFYFSRKSWKTKIILSLFFGGLWCSSQN